MVNKEVYLTLTLTRGA